MEEDRWNRFGSSGIASQIFPLHSDCKWTVDTSQHLHNTFPAKLSLDHHELSKLVGTDSLRVLDALMDPSNYINYSVCSCSQSVVIRWLVNWLMVQRVSNVRLER